MGYHTDYMLNIHGKGWEKIYDDVLQKIDQGDLISCKWYDHADDMIKISKEYPNHIFKLYGVGENGDDIWAKYFMNGEMQFEPTKIIYPECRFKLQDEWKEDWEDTDA